MFEQLFTRQAAIDRHHSSPFASERLSYLSHLIEQGHSDSRLYSVAHLLMAIARHIPLNKPGIDRVEIEASAEAWARTTHRSALCLHTGKREFVFHATKWLRLLGRLHEPQRQQPFALETDAFLRHGQQDRGLASSTLDRYRRYLTEFLVRLYEQNKTLHDVTLDEISAHIQIVAQRKLKRTSISHHVTALRAFFRYAHSRGWCKAGLAAIDAPRIYRLESLPRGPRGAMFNGYLQLVQATRRARSGITRCCWS
jgi:integrase/recombinase XerD